MKERPIIFNSEMVTAILDGRKTQTRRVMKPQPDICRVKKELIGGLEWRRCYPQGIGHNPKKWGFYTHSAKPYSVPIYEYNCPYGQPGNRLWVRETFQTGEHIDDFPLPEYQIKKDTNNKKWVVNYKADNFGAWLDEFSSCCWTPSIHMFRYLSRITLEVADVRVERLQKISKGDVEQEGFKNCTDIGRNYVFGQYWNSIHKKEYRWEDNPWVWIISFRMIKQ